MRAKFHCDNITICNKEMIQVSLSAVQSDENLENQDFNRWTPSGTLVMTVDNPKAKDFFSEGKEFYLDFTEAEK